MRLFKLIIYISIPFFIFASCQQNIEFNEEISKPMVVVHSFITPDSVVTASVSLSRFFLNDTASFQSINNADVAVIVNGTLKEKMNLLANGQYQGTYRPAIDDTVKLVVKVPSMNEVSSVTSINTTPVIITVDTTKISQDSYYSTSSTTDTLALVSDFKINYTLKFTDNGNEKNYYKLVVHSKEHKYQFIYGHIIDQISDRYFSDLTNVNNSTTNPITGTITGDNTNTNSGNKYNVFSDDLFNGKTYSLSFGVYYGLYTRYPSNQYNIDGDRPEKIEVFVSLQSISKDYYSYLKSRSASGGDDFFSEPVQITNNIVGGIGFFGSYTSSNVVRFDLK